MLLPSRWFSFTERHQPRGPLVGTIVNSTTIRVLGFRLCDLYLVRWGNEIVTLCLEHQLELEVSAKEHGNTSTAP